MGTVEFTGLVIMQSIASGQFLGEERKGHMRACVCMHACVRVCVCVHVCYLAQASTKFFTMEALVLKRSSRVIPEGIGWYIF